MDTPQVFRKIDNTPVGSIIVVAVPDGALTIQIISKTELPGGLIGITGILYSPNAENADLTTRNDATPIAVRQGSPVVIIREGAEN